MGSKGSDLHQDGTTIPEQGRYNLPTVWNNVLKSRVQGPGPRTLDNTNLPPVSS